ncbi:MAG TPA: VWA domain-containing protein [Planctomycetota bacterium]|jgi:HEAT repeat protein|nr:VWA domain-containing protein [Planctomycetota bacterium]HJM38659.1 VWA domain-containing protein [Planctomycetota bacterium]|tara:strand:+ start:242 stop:2059 length:1818 start_codon:yes stop_codon:yes gene_type:complete
MKPSPIALALSLLFALGASERACAQESVQQLLRQIEEEKDEVPLSIIRDLAKHGTSESLEAMCRAVKILKKPSRLSVAYYSFKHFNTNASLSKDSVDFLMKEIVSRKTAIARLAVTGLGGLMPSAENALLEVAKKNQDTQCRSIALKPLLDYFQENPKPENLTLLLDNFVPKKSGKSSKLIEILEGFPLPEHRKDFERRLLDEKYPLVRKLLLLQVLLGSNSQGLEDLALKCLNNPNPSITLSALRVAQRHNLPLSKKTLNRLGKHADPAIRMTALVTLVQGNENSKEVAKKLRKWERSRDPVQRQSAANAYGLLALDVCIPALEVLMQDSTFSVRHDAIMTLQQLRHPTALEALISGLDHRDEMTSGMIQKTLRSLTGEGFGASKHMWKKWWGDHRAGFTFPTEKEVEYRLRNLEEISSGGATSVAFFGLPVISNHVAFVIDTSSSMLNDFSSTSHYGDTTGTRLSTAKAQLLIALKGMPDGSRFNIFTFGAKGESWEESLVKLNSKTRASVKKYIERLTPTGQTAMFDALELAFNDREVDTIFLLSDGVPSGGKIDDPDLILNEIQRWNQTRRIPIHCVSIGGPTHLLRKISRETSGEFFQVN